MSKNIVFANLFKFDVPNKNGDMISKECAAKLIEQMKEKPFPVVIHDIRDFCKEYGVAIMTAELEPKIEILDLDLSKEMVAKCRFSLMV